MVTTGWSSLSKELLFDSLRGRHVTATPEERVRQRWICHMVGALGYPRELLAIEKQLQELPHLAGSPLPLPERRIDLLCYGRGVDSSSTLYPLLLIECKATPLTEQALHQVLGYNAHVGARFVALVAENQAYFCEATQNRQGASLPTYQELLNWIVLS
jgi:hypothetical protein